MILHLWHVNPNLVLRGFVDSLNCDPDSMTRILDICQEQKVNFEWTYSLIILPVFVFHFKLKKKKKWACYIRLLLTFYSKNMNSSSIFVNFPLFFICHFWEQLPDIPFCFLMFLYYQNYLFLLFLYSDFLFILQIISSVLDMIPSPYAIRLAALASRKELVDLEKWLIYNLNTYKDIFFEVISSWPSSLHL